MPLLKGTSRATFSRNVREMVRAGHPLKQSLAAAYRQAGKHGEMFPRTTRMFAEWEEGKHPRADNGQFGGGGSEGGGKPDKKSSHDKARGEWKERQARRDSRRQSLEAATSHGLTAALGQAVDVPSAHAAVHLAGVAEKAAAALEAAGGNGSKVRELVEKGRASISKREEKATAAAEKHKAIEAVFKEADAIASAAEHAVAAHEAQAPEEYTGDDEAEQSKYEKAQEKWEAEYDKLQAKAEKTGEKRDGAEEKLTSASERLDEAQAALGEEWDKWAEKVGGAIDDEAETAGSALDAEEEKDSEPEEPDEEDEGEPDKHSERFPRFAEAVRRFDERDHPPTSDNADPGPSDPGERKSTKAGERFPRTASLFAEWAMAEKSLHNAGDTWRGPSGRYFTKRQDGRVVPAANPEAAKAKQEKRDTREKARSERQKAQEEKAKRKAEKPHLVDKAEAAIKQLKESGGKLGHREMHALAGQLLEMTKPQMHELKKRLGLKAGGKKYELASKLAARALAGVREKKPEAKAPEEKPTQERKELWQQGRKDAVPQVPPDPGNPPRNLKQMFGANPTEQQKEHHRKLTNEYQRKRSAYLKAHKAHIEASNAHLQAVKDALAAGKTVPPDVLEDYPYLKPPAKEPAAKPEPKPAEAAKGGKGGSSPEVTLAAASRLLASVPDVGGMQRISMADLLTAMRKDNPGLTPQEMHKALEKLQAAGTIRIGGHSGSPDDLPANVRAAAMDFNDIGLGLRPYVYATPSTPKPKAAAPAAAKPEPKPAEAAKGGNSHHAAVAHAVQSLAAKNHGLVHLGDLKDATGLSTADLHAAVNDLRRQGVLTATPAEGRNGISARDREHGIKQGDQTLAFISPRQGEESKLADLAKGHKPATKEPAPAPTDRARKEAGRLKGLLDRALGTGASAAEQGKAAKALHAEAEQHARDLAHLDVPELQHVAKVLGADKIGTGKPGLLKLIESRLREPHEVHRSIEA